MSTAAAVYAAELRALAQNIRDAIAEHKTNPHAVAKVAGIPSSSMYRKLNRTPGCFGTRELLRIAAALEVNPSELWAGGGVLDVA